MILSGDLGYGAVISAIYEISGLTFPPARRPSVEESIRRVMARVGVDDLASLAGLVYTDVPIRDELLTELTVGETYFFRDAEQFAHIRRVVIPSLLANRPAGQPILAWSAGCASGEEPYSLAITCHEMGIGQDTWIVGTDISPRRLQVAREGRYSNWSFRGVPTGIIEKYFDRRGEFLHLTPEIRDRVEFRRLDLVGDPPPTFGGVDGGFDLILCRNLMIYLDEGAIATVAQRLIGALSDDGWLFLGASDPILSEYVECTVITTENGLAYQRVRPGAMMPAKVERPEAYTGQDSIAEQQSQLANPYGTGTRGVVQPLGPRLRPHKYCAEQIRGAYLRKSYREAAALASHATTLDDADEWVWVIWVRSLANQDQLEEASQVCAHALARYSLSVELLYLYSIVMNQAGQYRAAAVSARRALYLDRGSIMAHLALAHSLTQLTELVGARRSLENALRLLDQLPSDSVVPASDGESAGHLSWQVRTHLELLGGMS